MLEIIPKCRALLGRRLYGMVHIEFLGRIYMYIYVCVCVCGYSVLKIYSPRSGGVINTVF